MLCLHVPAAGSDVLAPIGGCQMLFMHVLQGWDMVGHRPENMTKLFRSNRCPLLVFTCSTVFVDLGDSTKAYWTEVAGSASQGQYVWRSLMSEPAKTGL